MVQTVDFLCFFGFLNYTVALKYNNPFKEVELCFSMVEEKYYLVEKVKNLFMVDAFNINIVKQTGENLEMLSSTKIKPKEIGVNLEKGVISCTDNHYKMEEITEKQAIKTLKEMDINYANWQHYMSNSEDMSSSHLTGPGGDSLC